ncbi:MAG: multicopper oxidase domain-containing protein [Byssovorax sp.]
MNDDQPIKIRWRAPMLLASGLALFLASGCDGGSSGSGGGGSSSTTGTTGTTTTTSSTGGGGTCIELADGSCVEETFHNPPVLAPNADGVYELTLKPTELIVDGKRQCGRAYNGMVPAPTIDVAAPAAGEQRKVRVDLKNAFTKSDYRGLHNKPCTCTDTVSMMSCPPEQAHDPTSTCKCTDDEGMMCHLYDFNTTNLHAHGSHVRPDYATGGGCVEKNGLSCRTCSGDTQNGAHECYFADDVISHVMPGMGVQHRWDLDEDGQHHAGLDWYHPHVHGSTAIQVASGATGALIVRGPLDEIPGIKNAKERVLLITTPPINATPLADGQACDEDHITFNDFEMLGTTSEKQTNLINGMRRPRMVIPPGQIERWRFLHGSFLDEVFLVAFRGKDHDCNALDLMAPPIRLTQIGRDGLTLPKPPGGVDWPFAPNYIFMSPGYRVDALLDGNELHHGDTVCLLAARFLQEDTTGTTPDPVGITKPPTPEEIIKAASNGDIVAIVNVTNAAGPPTETKMPDLAVVAAEAPSMMLKNGTVDANEACKAAQAEGDVEQLDQLAALWMIFNNQSGPDECACPDHNINCKGFEHTNRKKYPYDRVLTLGAVDHWRVVSGFDGHPFHIHINPFLVCPLPPEGSPDPNAKGRIFEPPFAHWRDTYLVNLDRKLDMLTEYRAFTGNYVYHCHKLTHEDHGMMELIHVCDPAKEDCGSLCSGGACAWNQCAPGDDGCLRALHATECLLDPSKCPDALLRCAQCDTMSCPPDAHCRSDADYDDKHRCAPGCLTDDDCAVTDTCDAGSCKLAPPCAPPCAPGTMCKHGACQ